MIRPDQTLTEEKVQAICEFAQKGFCSPSTLNKLGAHARKVAVTAALGLSVAGASSAFADKLPPEKSMATLKWDLVGQSDLWEYKALPSYNEAQ